MPITNEIPQRPTNRHLEKGGKLWPPETLKRSKSVEQCVPCREGIAKECRKAQHHNLAHDCNLCRCYGRSILLKNRGTFEDRMTRCTLRNHCQVCQFVPEAWKCLRDDSLCLAFARKGVRHKMHSDCKASLPRCIRAHTLLDGLNKYESDQTTAGLPTISIDCFPVEPKLSDDDWKLTMCIKMTRCGILLKTEDEQWYHAMIDEVVRSSPEELEKDKAHYFHLGTHNRKHTLRQRINNGFKASID